MITLIGGDLYQWDTGRVVLVGHDSGYTIQEVHFTTKKMEYAYVAKTYESGNNTYCAIPNILLQQYWDIYCYEVRENEAGEESISTTIFSVTKRNRPVDYVYTEPEKYTYKQLEERVKKLEASIAEAKTASDEAALLANEAYTLAEETKNAMVRSVNNNFPDENGNVTIDGSSGGSENFVEF